MIGFIHGVMNTDNSSIAGETIDYGPCAFMDAYNPQAVFSAIDEQGRYAYGQQPAIGLWNLTRFAECLLPLLAGETSVAIAQAEVSLDTYRPTFERAYEGRLRRKLGLLTECEGDGELGRDLLQAMAANGADFTLTFRRLCAEDFAEGTEVRSAAAEQPGVRSLFENPADFDDWAARWRRRLGQEPVTAATRQTAMRAVNPLYIPRNHLVEAVIRAAIDNGDFAPFHELVTVLSKPFEAQPDLGKYALPPAEHEQVSRTFCGT
jgi:serine/tyrosine/threonine adenylyltransferase